MTVLLRTLAFLNAPRAGVAQRCPAVFSITAALICFGVVAASSHTVYGTLTLGFGFNVDASLDDGVNNRWEDTVAGNPSGFDLRLDTANGVSWTTVTSGLSGITAAYSFPGGLTGNSGGALLGTTGTATDRSFQHAPGDWSNQSVSIEMWFKPDNLTAGGNGQILFEDGGTTGFGFFVAGNELRLRKLPISGSNTGAVHHDISSSAGQFIQAVGTFNVSNGAMELFVNGLRVGTASANTGTWSGGDPAGVGTRGGANTGGLGGGQMGTESFQGQMAIFRVYNNRVLTADEVANNYAVVAADEAFFEDDSGDALWTTTTNWLNNIRPTAVHDAYIGNGLAATIDAGVAATDVWIGHDAATLPGEGTLTIAGPGASLTANQLYVGSGGNDGTLTIDGPGASLAATRLHIGTGGAEGTVNFLKGTMTLTGTSADQSVYVGRDNGSIGTLIMGTPGGNNAETTLTYSGGRFEVAQQAGSTGKFVLHSGAVSGNQNFIVTQGDGTAEVEIYGGSFVTTADMNFNSGNGTYLQQGGFVSVRTINQSSNSGRSSAITVDGGILRINSGLGDRAGTSTINLGGTGRLEILGNSTMRAVKHFNHTGSGVLQLDLTGSGGVSAPLNVKQQATFAGTPALELVNEIPINAATTASWTGGTGNWDTHVNWSGGAIPAHGANTIGTGSTITVVTSANDITDAHLLTAAGWSIDTSDSKAVKLVRTGDPLGGAATAQISGTSSVVTRHGDLRIAPQKGADATGLNLENGASLTLSGTSRLIVGGDAQGTVHHDGALSVGGDLLFGGGGLQGGTYNLNGGSLTVLGSIIEGDSGAPNMAVDSAQLHINGGTLSVAGDITVQRFSLGEVAGSDGAAYTIPAGQVVYSTGSTAVGSGGTNASLVVDGTLVADGASYVAERSGASGTLTIHAPGSAEFTSSTPFRVGPGANASGAVEILGGTFLGRGVELATGSNSQADVTLDGGSFTATSGLTLATNASGTATLTLRNGAVLNVAGGNLETAGRGKGTVVMYGGTFNQNTSNLIVGQNAGSDATFEMYGGTVHIAGNGQLRVTNRKDVTGRFLLYGGTVNVGGQMDTFNAADAGTTGFALIVVDDTHAESNAPAVLNVGTNLVLGNVATDGDTQMDLLSGTVNVGGNLELSRGAGNTATFNLSGGTLNLTGGNVVFGAGTGEFNFTGGRLQDVGSFGASLIQQGGTLAPGASPGITAIAGNYHLQEPAVLEIELFGTGGVPGVDFDFVDVAGTATLDGWIDVLWDREASWFDLGDTFLVLRATEIVGQPQLFDGFPRFEAAVLQNYLDSGFDMLQLTMVPEPNTLLLALFGLAAAMLGGRRRCRASVPAARSPRKPSGVGP